MKRKREEEFYLRGLKEYRDLGVEIYIDGEEMTENNWNKVLEVHEDGSFYMGDYISTPNGNLKEIRFDKVYNR